VAAPVTFRRRALLQAGTALVVGFRLGDAPAQGAAAELALNADVRIDARGQVHVSTTQTEMGQGTLTGIAMIIADELDADWSRVQVQTMRPDGKRFMITGGSGAIQGAWEPARRAGAQARAMLLQAGATSLGAAAADCRTERHAVVHTASGRRIDYRELVGAAAKLPVPDKPVLKADDALQLVGKPLAANNLTTIVRVSERYGLDLRVPGMLVATIERSPIVNGRLASFDDRAARRVPGVVDVVVVRGNIFPTAV
jgi:isoquinoline 1-oxidoreductase beta subunit